jgi:hypothetical protein
MRKEILKLTILLLCLSIFAEIISFFDGLSFSSRIWLFGILGIITEIIELIIIFMVLFLLPNLLLNGIFHNKIGANFNPFMKIIIRFCSVLLISVSALYLYCKIFKLQMPNKVVDYIELFVPYLIITVFFVKNPFSIFFVVEKQK